MAKGPDKLTKCPVCGLRMEAWHINKHGRCFTCKERSNSIRRL